MQKQAVKKFTWYKHLYLDGHSGKFSGTTLRTWLLFLLLFFYACLLAVAVLLDLFTTNLKHFNDAFNFLELLALIFAGGGTLYLGRSMVNRRQRRDEELGD